MCCCFIEWCNHNSGFLMVVITAIYTFATILILKSNRKANILAQQEIDTFKEIHRQERRPYLTCKIVEEVKNGSSNKTWWIENIGKTTACNINISTKPPLEELKYMVLLNKNNGNNIMGITLTPQAETKIGCCVSELYSKVVYGLKKSGGHGKW